MTAPRPTPIRERPKNATRVREIYQAFAKATFRNFWRCWTPMLRGAKPNTSAYWPGKAFAGGQQ
jgi:hypothetical protein